MYYIGLMSGTSADAIDAALVDIDTHASITVIATHRRPYPPRIATQVESTIAGQAQVLSELAQLDVALGVEFAEAATALMGARSLRPEQIAAIGSHGQTVGHFPDAPHPVTVQLGCPATIAERTGVRTVADFRISDMAAGGQGAPLAPAFHSAAFGSTDQTRVIVNIGGIANLTVLPPAGGAVTGFDTGPGNTLLDAWIRHDQGMPYDAQGAWAASGNVDADFLTSLLADPYFKTAPPKSTGRERFNLAWLAAIRKAQRGPEGADMQATLTRLTARTIADAVVAAAPEAPTIHLCGGGVHNATLVAEIGSHLPGRRIQDTATLGIHPDWVEAVAFAWLAHRRMHKQAGNIPGVTGARHSAVLGGLWEPGSDVQECT